RFDLPRYPRRLGDTFPQDRLSPALPLSAYRRLDRQVVRQLVRPSARRGGAPCHPRQCRDPALPQGLFRAFHLDAAGPAHCIPRSARAPERRRFGRTTMTDGRVPVVIYRDHLLRFSEIWVRSQGEALESFAAHYVGSKRRDDVLMPRDRTYVVSGGG